MKLQLKYILSVIAFGITGITFGQRNLLENQISDSLTVIANSYTFIGRVNVVGFTARNGAVAVSMADKFSNMPFRPENVQRIYNAIKTIVERKNPVSSVVCLVEGRRIEDLIPNYYNPTKIDESRQFSVQPAPHPLVVNTSRPFEILNGLQNRHIALWQSHGWYYNQRKMRWEWQRPRYFQTVEDLYTQSYVLPFLVPMLEKAGANVLLPRERDTQLNEVIVDNDSRDNTSRYREQNEYKRWIKDELPGFANSKKTYLFGENPFALGTYRETTTNISSDEQSRVEWTPNIPEAGKYAVYVSYKTLDSSTTDARYTVVHRGIKTEFSVNQTMNGGTWLYLGHFNFDKGRNNQNKVILTNVSSEDDKIITADAVKFGGGMGNMARNPYNGIIRDTITATTHGAADSLITKPMTVASFQTAYTPEISQRPRYNEGSRYWLQWAGMPDSIYSRTRGMNDYSDDFQSRGYWVNYLAGGSAVLPNYKGKNIPIDLAMAFHTDAGATLGDSIVGTLGICTIKNNVGNYTFTNGISRWASRDLTDIIQTQVVSDIRKTFAPEWSRRGMWNKSYSESRVPEVPTMLLELLSHQNFSDMRYGFDPRFRFTVSRAIYKGILRYISAANKTDYVVQPLPVEQFSCHFAEKNKVELSWKAVTDSLESTAQPNNYIVYTRVDEGDFDNGIMVDSTDITLPIQPGKIYSFKVAALNKGGESFPSEILSSYQCPNSKAEVMIVNGFDRLSAPASFVIDSTYAGFLTDYDAGVPYMNDIAYVGKQFEFKRHARWKSDDAPGFGSCYANFEAKPIAGNTFDYAYIHGKAMKLAGYSFVSCSEKAVLAGDINLNHYKLVDLILGKQKQTFIGNAKKTPNFKTFPLALQQSIQSYCQAGGNLLVSGAYIGSDLCEPLNSIKSDREFLKNVLKINYVTSHASAMGNVRLLNSELRGFRTMDFSYYDTPNGERYYVESPDAIEPADSAAYSICRYVENNRSAAVAYDGAYKVCSFGFPLETIKSDKDRASLMESILTFLNVAK
ncbi:MAG: xanthan lyase [Paludibacter sp.]